MSPEQGEPITAASLRVKNPAARSQSPSTTVMALIFVVFQRAKIRCYSLVTVASARRKFVDPRYHDRSRKPLKSSTILRTHRARFVAEP
jgi:hypothetical protein